MGEAQCDQCGGTGWYLTPPLECRDGKMRRTRCKCGCGKAGLTDLARENAELREKLADAENVIADYTATIREHMAAEKAAKATNGEPMAWAVFCADGDKYDYLVFPHSEDAKQHAEILDADEEEGTEPRGVIPLYADVSGAIAKAEKARDDFLLLMGGTLGIDTAKWNEEGFPGNNGLRWELLIQKKIHGLKMDLKGQAAVVEAARAYHAIASAPYDENRVEEFLELQANMGAALSALDAKGDSE